MITSTSTDGGFPVRCQVCAKKSIVQVSRPPGDSVCPYCGTFLWVYAIVESFQQSEFIPNLSIPELHASDRREALASLAVAIGNHLNWTDSQQDQFLAAALRREDLGSTAIGRGYAVPHAKINWIEHCFTVLAFLPNPIEFDSLDGNPVHPIFMIAAPNSRPGDHLRILERIWRTLPSIGPTGEP